MRKVITPRREDADPAVTEVADQERVGHVSPGSVERASGSDARDLSAIGAELVHHADADAEAFRSGARRGARVQRVMGHENATASTCVLNARYPAGSRVPVNCRGASVTCWNDELKLLTGRWRS
jgi:hypothetical protein